jgi:hypothetical protein
MMCLAVMSSQINFQSDLGVGAPNRCIPYIQIPEIISFSTPSKTICIYHTELHSVRKL